MIEAVAPEVTLAATMEGAAATAEAVVAAGTSHQEARGAAEEEAETSVVAGLAVGLAAVGLVEEEWEAASAAASAASKVVYSVAADLAAAATVAVRVRGLARIHTHRDSTVRLGTRG